MSVTMESVHRPRPRTPGLWPREHGAYVQLLAPLLTSLAFVPPTLAAAGYALGACAAFLAHEPLLVLGGRRGARTRRELDARARVRLALLVGLSGVGFSVALALSQSAARAALLIPAALSLCVSAILLRDLERTLLGELAVGAALASFSLPVLVASGVATGPALALTAGWTVVHGLATLVARAVVYRKRLGRGVVVGASVSALATLGAATLLALSGIVPLSWCFAPLPFALVLAAVASGLFRPRSPKPVGWALAAASVAALLLFGLGLRTLG
jgi:hypothetical protein